MKYIRTKDGIMKIDFEIEDELPVMIGVQTEECDVGEYRGIEVIKQADTIEELCDYVFCKDCFGELQIKKMWGGKMQIQSLLLDRVSDVKLAILTDKGLIYVAKMKGVLPNGEIDWELL